jgi:hypothetical protein
MATRRSQARRFQAAGRSTRRSLRAARRSTRRSLQTSPLIGWLVAAALLVALAFVVGGPAAEQGLLGSHSSPTPPAHAALPIRFGLALDRDTNRAIRRTRSYHPGQTFAYSVTLAQPSATTSIFVEVERISGPPRLVQERSIQHITAGRRTFAFTVPSDDLLAAWGAGRFEMRIYLGQGEVPIAAGRFRLVAAPASSIVPAASG